MSKKDNAVSAAVDSMISSRAVGQDTTSELGVTQEYKRELYDSKKRKDAYSDKVFGDKKTIIDPMTDEVLHKSHNAAKKKYHSDSSKAWAEHAYETDHINPIKAVHNVAKHNPFLTDQDLADIVNSESNFRASSKSVNASKQDKNDWDIIADPNSGISTKGKAYMASEKVRADASMHAKFAARTAKNAGGEFVNGATNALIDSAFPIMCEAVNNLMKVASGEKSLDEAGKNTAKVAVEVAVDGGTNQLLADALGQDEAAQISKVAMIVKDSAVRYINGEIDESEFINEVGEKGVTIVAGMIGGTIGREIGGALGLAIGNIVIPGGAGAYGGYVVGSYIGEYLGSLITTIACSAIICSKEVLKHIDDYKVKEAKIGRLTSNALAEMDRQRRKLKVLVEKESTEWKITVDESFDMIIRSITNSSNSEEEFDGVTQELDKIMALFGSSAMFHSIEEFDVQLEYGALEL